jgi:O-antigen ligase
MIRDYPLQGVGPGNFRPIFEGRYNPELNDDLRRGEHAHNLWLQQTAELGIPGGLAFGVLWVWLLWMAWRLARDRGGLAAAICLALIGTTVSNVVDNVAIMVAGFRIYLLTWVLFGFVAAMVDDRSAAGRHDPARLPENLIVP